MRSWLLALTLFLTPVLVYWPAVSHEYGWRDDYAQLREVRDRPGWIESLTSSYGRPVYGFLLERSLQPLHEVGDLAALRLAATLFLALLGVLLWRVLRHSGWDEPYAALLAGAVTLLPGAQVLASWAIAWPIAFALVAGVGGFALVQEGLRRGGWRRAIAVLAGAGLYFVAGLTYQTSALFAVVPLAAALLTRAPAAPAQDCRWLVAHLGLLFLCMFSGWLLMNAVFASGDVPEAPQLQFEPHPLIKLLWFARNPLPNSLALFALRDRFDTPPAFFVMLALVVLLALLGVALGARQIWQRRRWLFAALALPFVAHSVSLAASSQAIGYRTLLPLSGVFLVLALFGLRALLARLAWRQGTQVVICGVILLVAAWLARDQSYTLIVQPQGREWQLMKAAVGRLVLDADTRVFLVRPALEHRSTRRIYADEFGSLTTDAEWAAEEMFKAALRERFPDGLPASVHFTLDTGAAPPALPFDLVVDLRTLGQGV